MAEKSSENEDDVPISDFEERDASEEEIKSLPHVVDKIPMAAWFVIVAGSFERFTYFGIIAPWRMLCLGLLFHGNSAVPGALNLGQSTASTIYNAFFLVSYITPMAFAIISDAWLGRYLTLILGLLMYLCGATIMLVTSFPFALDAGAGLPGLIVSMIFIALGAGCIKSTYFPLLGDQYNQRKPRLKQLKNGKLAVIDGTRTIQFLYNAYYWATNLMSLSSIAVTFLEKEYDFWSAFALTLASTVIAAVLFIVASPRLVKVPPQGTNLTKAGRVLLCATKSGFKLNNTKSGYQQARYGRTVPWSDLFVDEMKRGVLACRVIVSFLVFYLIIGQQYNNLVSQAGQIELHGVPNDAIQAASGVACVIMGPIIQYMYSLLAKKKIAFGPIARITVAFLFCAGSMAYTAGVQKIIYNNGPCYDRPLACAGSEDAPQPNNVNVWIQLPTYFILAIAEIFGFVTASEYAYAKAPVDMKTIVQATTQLVAAVASALGIALSPVSKDPSILILYACLAAAMALTAALFWLVFRKYDKIDRELDEMKLESRSGTDATEEEQVKDK